MSFTGLDAVYTLDDAQVLAGLTRVERAAYRHAGAMDRVWGNAGRSLNKFVTGVNVPRLAFASVGAAVWATIKAVDRYEKEFPDLAFQSRAVEALGRAWLTLAGSVHMGVREASSFVDKLKVAEGLDLASSALAGLQDNIAFLFNDEVDDLNAARAGAERFSYESRREAAFRGLMDEATRPGSIGDPIYAAEMKAQREAREAREKYAKLAKEGTITVEQSRTLSEIVAQRGLSDVDAVRQRVFRENQAGAAREQKRLDEENAAAAKAAEIARDRLSDDLAGLRIQEMKLRGLDREADLADATLRIERQRREIIGDEHLTPDEKTAALIEVDRLGGSTLDAIARGQKAERFTYDSLAPGRASSVVSRLFFGPEGAQGGTAGDPSLNEARKQTRLLEDIKDRVGPARYGE